jgi:tetrahydromethanopterin S-methyltransferase subunit F
MDDRPSGWAVGFTVFAGVMMIMMGMLHALWGLAAIIEDEFFVVTRNYLYDVDVTGWGWVHLIAGAIVILAGFWVFTGAVWARTIGVILAVLSAIANFLTIPYYPVWSLVIIAVDIVVIWALTVRGRDITRPSR